ncbi:hypothetical protein CFC21_082206 [Triticum aestivum]|uniref:GRF-type domain-containing protein n=2 Tax=Triticum aestivum TaxID=4565 RepID=A0A3B6RTB5_WHEAT|nr:hypothetical protein CFC21_082206 [Triticum aestivum]
MVSWSDDSEESGYEYSSGGSPIKISATIEDPNYSGVDDEVMVMCEHGQPAKRHVCFSDISTGRRFLACGLDEASSCGVVQWVDEEWPEHLLNALHKLWLLYEDCQRANRMACLEHASLVHNLTSQKNKLQETYEKLVEDVNNLLDTQDNIPKENEVQQGGHEEITPPLDNNISALKEQLGAMDAENKELKQKVDQLRSIQVAQGNVIRNLKFAHLKEKEKLSTERRNFKFHIADLVKASDKNKRKLKDIKDFCDEE